MTILLVLAFFVNLNMSAIASEAVRPSLECEYVLGSHSGISDLQIPKSMKMSNSVRLRFSFSKKIKETNSEENRTTDQDLSPRMILRSTQIEAKIHTSADDFKVIPLTPEIQVVSNANIPAEWQWRLEPVSVGRKRFRITLSAIVDVNNHPTASVIQTCDQEILVEGSWWETIRGFAESNWQWLWSTILIPAVGWIGWSKRGKLFRAAR